MLLRSSKLEICVDATKYFSKNNCTKLKKPFWFISSKTTERAFYFSDFRSSTRSFPSSNQISAGTRQIHHPFFQPHLQEKIRIGVIGAGQNTKLMHIPNLMKQNGVEIACISNRTIESAQKVAEQFKIPQVYSSWQEVVHDKTMDAIVIGTWPYMHKLLTIQALLNNKHVLCEARMAMNATEAREMLQVAQSKPHLVAQIVPSPYTLKFDKTIQNFIQSKALGELIAVDVRDTISKFPNPNDPLTWRQNIDKSGLNIMGMGIWVEALYRWIGPARSVFASGKVTVKQRIDPDTNTMHSVQIPDYIDIIAEMACGAQARLQFSTVLGHSPPPSQQVYLYGTEGTLKLDIQQSQLLFGTKSDENLNPVSVEEKDIGVWRVEEEFINAIRGKEKTKLTTFQDGLKYMEFTEAVWQSLQQKKTIPLPS